MKSYFKSVALCYTLKSSILTNNGSIYQIESLNFVKNLDTVDN